MKIMLKEAALKFKGYTVYKLALELKVPYQTVYSWAKGRTQPSYESLDKICNVLECKIQDLLEAEPVQNKLFD